MAEPTGPTVAKGPDELDVTDANPTPTDAVGAATPAPGSPEDSSPDDSSTGETSAEDRNASVDATGTAAPATEPEANGTVDAGDVTPSGPAAGEDPSSAPVLDTAAHRAEANMAKEPQGGDHPSDTDTDGDGQDRDDEDVLDDDLEDDDGSKRQSGGLLTKKLQLDARAILLVLVVVGLAAGAYVLGQRQVKVPTQPSAAGTTPTTKFTVPQDFVSFEDKETGIKLALPKDWPQFSTQELDPSYRLLVGVPNAKDTLRVRVNAYSSEVTQANIGDQKAVIDAIFAGEKVNILADQPLTLNGMPALFYVYKFNDATGEPGIHAHFFVFQGKKMVTMVFESVPESRYPLLAPVFDQIKDSLVVAPGPPPAFLESLTGGTPSATTVPGPGAPTTVAPATTAPPTRTP